MKKLFVVMSMAGAVSLLLAGVAGMFEVGTSSVHASRLAGISGAGATGIQVQNLDAASAANISADFYPHDTTKTGSTTLTASGIPAGGAWNIYLPSAPTLENGAYAAIISADRQIAAIARTDWLSSGGAAIYSNVMPGETVSLPLVVIDYYGQSSLISIQNTDTGRTASVTVNLFGVGSATPDLTETYSIGPGKAFTIDTATTPAYMAVDPSTAGGFLGSMIVTADVPVGVQSFVDITSSDKAVYGFEGVPSEDAAEVLYAPLFRRRHLGVYDTGISVVNPNASPVDVTVTYIGSGGSCAGTTTNHGPVSIAANSSHVFYQGPVPENGLPDNCLGAAVIRSTGGNILAIVNDAKNNTEESAAYNAMPESVGALKVALPLARNRFLAGYEVTTGIQVMNIGSGAADASPTNVTITFSDSDGAVMTGCTGCNASIAPLASHTFFPESTFSGVLPRGTYGSAVVESDSDPIVVIVNDFSFTGAMDAATYNGIKADL